MTHLHSDSGDNRTYYIRDMAERARTGIGIGILQKNVLGMPNFPYTFSLADGLRWITGRKNALNKLIFATTTKFCLLRPP